MNGQWCHAEGDEVCSGCGETQEPGWQYLLAWKEIYCEPCAEDLEERLRDSCDDDFEIDGVGFADPGGCSALRAETEENPRNLPCPECGAEDVLTPLDVAAGYRCNACADQAERGWD